MGEDMRATKRTLYLESAVPVVPVPLEEWRNPLIRVRCRRRLWPLVRLAASWEVARAR